MHGTLRVRGNRIVGQHGRPVQLMGMSLYWSIWGPEKYYNRQAIDWLVKDWKIDLIRAAMTVEIDQGDTDRGWLHRPKEQTRLIREVVEAAISNGIYVLVDWHTHLLQTNPARAFFEEMARSYGQYPNILWETYNEPIRQTWPEIAHYTNLVTAAIRPHSENLVIAGTRNWSQDVDEAAHQPLPDSNTAYSLHFYAGSHGADLRKKADLALGKDRALFITEWGTSHADGGRDGKIYPDESKAWLDWALAQSISLANWSLADHTEASAALRPGAPPEGGWDPEEWLSPSGQFVRGLIREVNAGKMSYRP